MDEHMRLALSLTTVKCIHANHTCYAITTFSIQKRDLDSTENLSDPRQRSAPERNAYGVSQCRPYLMPPTRGRLYDFPKPGPS